MLRPIFKTHYVTGIWIDFIVAAYVSGVAWLFAHRDKVDTEVLTTLS